jgi:hypothetical protein
MSDTDTQNVIPVDFTGGEQPETTTPTSEVTETPTPAADPVEPTLATVEIPEVTAKFSFLLTGYEFDEVAYRFRKDLAVKIPPAIDTIVDKWNDMDPEKREEIFRCLEAYFQVFNYTNSAGLPQPALPDELLALDGRFLGFLNSCINPIWAWELFKAGFESRSKEEQAALLQEAEATREQLQYAHLPQDGAKVKRPSGAEGFIPFEELKAMVDQGMLPPNPDLTKATIDIMSRPRGIVHVG